MKIKLEKEKKIELENNNKEDQLESKNNNS